MWQPKNNGHVERSASTLRGSFGLCSQLHGRQLRKQLCPTWFHWLCTRLYSWQRPRFCYKHGIRSQHWMEVHRSSAIARRTTEAAAVSVSRGYVESRLVGCILEVVDLG